MATQRFKVLSGKCIIGISPVRHKVILILILNFHVSIFKAEYNSEPGESFIKESKTLEKQCHSWLKNQAVEFLENKGQMVDMNGHPVPEVLFKTAAPGVDLYITEKGLTYVFLAMKEVEGKEEKEKFKPLGALHDEKIKVSYEKLEMLLAGAHIKKENVIKEDTSIAYYNYLTGAQPKGIYHVKKYRKLTIKNVYPGIDWILYNSSKTGFKYDFVVHPGADANLIELIYRSKEHIQLSESGGIILKSKLAQLEEHAPYSYLAETQQGVESRFKLISNTKRNGMYENHFSFDFPNLPTGDAKQTLVIDPQLVWATFYGDNGIEGTVSLETDALGNVIMVGYTSSGNLPLLNAGTYFQSAFSQAFIVKFNNNGTLLWATYYVNINGSGNILLFSVATDNSNNVFLCGVTSTTNFPTQNATTFFQGSLGGSSDAYISKFDNLGNCIWATYYGGLAYDDGSTLATDQNGNVYMVGTTASTNFPLQNAGTYFEGSSPGSDRGYIVKFDNSGNRLWSTYLSGIQTPPIVTADGSGNVYVTGKTSSSILPVYNPGGTTYFQSAGAGANDAYIFKFDNTGNQLWTTYYGGSLNDNAYSLKTDKYGNLFVLGITQSLNFPLQNAGTYFQGALNGTQNDLFLLKFNGSGTRQWATYFGGSRIETLHNNDHISIDTCGFIYIGCTTTSRNFPVNVTCNPSFYKASMDTSFSVSKQDIAISRFSNTGNLVWSTYFGGDGNNFRASLDVDNHNNLFLSGEWTQAVNSLTYPLVNPGGTSFNSNFTFADDVYIAKFQNSFQVAPTFSYANPSCLSDPASTPSTSPGFVSGGTYASNSGLNLNPQTGQITPSLSLPGNYTVTYSYPGCLCSSTSSLAQITTTLTIQTGPSISVSGNFTICFGAYGTYSASGASNYTWNVGATASTVNLAPAITSTYTVIGKNSNGCSAKTTFTVYVRPCTGLEEYNFGSVHLKIYPNPNNGDFTVSSDSDVDLILNNELGQTLRHIRLSAANEHQLSIGGLAGGVYFLSEEGKKKSTHKIVVQR